MQEGGNKPFFEFISEYKIQDYPTRKKYEHRSAQYYSMRMRAKIDGQPFPYDTPLKTDIILKTQHAVAHLEKGVLEGADWLKKKWQSSGITDKINGMIYKDH